MTPLPNRCLPIIVLVILFLWGGYSKQAESPIKYTIQTLVSNLQKPGGLHMYNNEIYFVDQYNNIVQKRSANGDVTIIAGKVGQQGSTGDGQLATSAKLYYPYGVFVMDNIIYIADQYNCKIRMVSSNIIATSVGVPGCGDAIGATGVTQLDHPPAIFVPYTGLYYIADFYNHKVKKVESGTVTTIAGTGTANYNGDGIQASTAQLNEPHGVFVRNDKIYIVDKKNHRIRMIQPDGKISTVAGNGTLGFGPDNVAAKSSMLQDPVFVYVTQDEVIYISDHENNRIRRVKNGIISTIAGNGIQALADDGSISHLSPLSLPAGLFVNETTGQIIFAERGTNKIRVLMPTCDNGYNLNSNGTQCFTSFCNGIESINFATVCSGRGKCIGNNQCQCDEPTSWGGANCEKPKCSGILQGESNVCNGRGLCSAVDSCQCTSPAAWGGQNCEKPKCNGVLQGNAGVCNSRGVCSAPDSCTCNVPNNWGGSDCQYPKCDNILSTDPKVCSANGTCVGVGSCACNTNYTGVFCQFPKCNSIAASDANVCNRNGVCTAPNVCICDPNYSGQFCENPKCGSYFKGDPLVCNSRGICSSIENCNCNDQNNWGGNLCQFPKCNNIISTDGTVCNSRGTCQSPNTCQCTDSSSWGGVNCEKPKCYGILQGESNVCSGKGTCIGVNQCSCVNGYGGERCQYPKCNGILSNSSIVCSGHGTCVGIDNCQCSPLYTGALCQVPICFGINATNSTNVCSGHGVCIAGNQCSCSSNYYSSDCSVWDCFGIQNNSTKVCSGRGVCQSPNICSSCQTGYYGNNCETYFCGDKMHNSTDVCSRNGNCTAPNNCSCLNGYFGNNCESYNCSGLLNNSSKVCSSHGYCSSPNNCICSSGYSGNECENYSCNNVNHNSSMVCSGNGNCTLPNICQCKDGYFGDNCETFYCNAQLHNSTSVCSGFGTCTSPNSCTCKIGYDGLDCETFYCNGVLFNNSNVCSGHGNCNITDTCICNEGFTGINCDLFHCFGVIYTNSSLVCSGQGSCIYPNTCACKPDYFGANCKEKIVKEKRLIEIIGKPKAVVKGLNQVIDMNIIGAYLEYINDFESIRLSNNCTNCTWTNLKYSWQISDGNQKIYSQPPEYILASFIGRSTNGLYKLSFSPVLSLKGSFHNNGQGNLTLSVKFYNSQNLSETVEFLESIPILSPPERLHSNVNILPQTGMALSTLFNFEEDLNNWIVPYELSPLEFAFGFEYSNVHGENIVIRMNEFSKNLTCSCYLPYLSNNKTESATVQIYVIARDSLSNQYSKYFGSVQVLLNSEDAETLQYRIRHDERLSVILPYDQSRKQSNEIIYEYVNSLNLHVENPSLTLEVINQLTTTNSLENKVASILSSKLENFLGSVNEIIKSDKSSNGYLSKQRMSESDLKNTLSSASNILLNGFVNVTTLCSQLSSIIINQQASRVFSGSLDQNSYISDLINITTSTFLKTSSIDNVVQEFNGVTIDTDYILAKYDGYYKEIGLALITFDENLYTNGNSTQLTNSKEFTLYKSGSPLSLSNLIEPIYISFTLETNSSVSNTSLSCQFWNETNHKWEREGCSVYYFNNQTKQLTCQCNHTTLFAAFVEQETPTNAEFLKQVSSLYIAQISFGSLFLILSSITLVLLIVFRKSQPVTSRFVTPFIGMAALIIECALLLITQRGILLRYANSVLGNQNDFENSQSTVLQLQNGDLAANIISNIFTIIVNTITLTAIFSYLYQVLRFQVLKYFHHQIWLRFNSKEPKSETLLKVTKLFLSTKVMLIVMSVFVTLNVLYWTLWVILIRTGAITGTTYTHIVSISFTCSILLLGFIICCMIALDWIMVFLSKRKENEIIKQGQEQTTDNETRKLNFSLNDLLTGKSLEKLQKFDNFTTAKKLVKIPLKGVYENIIRLDSPLYFRAEMCLFVMCFTFLVISQIIGLSGLTYRKTDSLKMLLLNDSISLLFDILYLFSYLFVFGGYSLIVLFIHKIRKSSYETKQDEGEELVKLLEHAEGLQLFEWFCEKEYSLENLQLYLEIKNQNNVFENLDDSHQAQTIILHIYETYVKNGSLKEVNIPSDCKKSFVNLVQDLDSTDSKTKDIELENGKNFGKKNQISQELKESIRKSIETLQNQVLFNLSDTFSRFIFTQQFETYQGIVNYKNKLMKQANLE
ncbi:predicted protein [Naegleria gruberi]|uniref:Predicted protein n=1 Tax=Naegleria gruberi TaxID=5762 RepID=D2VML7_NAEGR|nr:uncharacterized protein NAEGRDRAFT_80558 [Naegleria gruberi]EFC42088.1 predicted protein [Naegleria gruberi]|eukprot:XP_002674832.1 predicted protein [Naegleria gruberi strain NEG-M]